MKVAPPPPHKCSLPGFFRRFSAGVSAGDLWKCGECSTVWCWARRDAYEAHGGGSTPTGALDVTVPAFVMSASWSWIPVPQVVWDDALGDPHTYIR